MKLLYHNDFNLGDALNPRLFSTLLPGVFDQDENEVFLGIGTLINVIEYPEKARKGYIFSTGAGYGTGKNLDPRWEVLCVRGPLTAHAFNLDRKLAITDGAILADTLLTQQEEKRYEFSYIPHHYSEEKFNGWNGICQELDIHFISPTVTEENTVDHILREISRSKVLICEALHGAILADAFRVPWIPVKAYGHINSFKWEDYAGSMELDLDIQSIPSIFSDSFLFEKLRSKNPAGLPLFMSGPVFRMAKMFISNSRSRIMSRMDEIRRKNQSHLCRDSILKLRREQLYEKLDKFRQ